MKYELIFPTALIILDLLACIVYLYKGDIRMAVYWASATMLTICVTYPKIF